MKTRHRHHPAAFTLIELMAVITIIVILAGLVVGGMGFVNERQAKEKAKVQLGMLEAALEEYKLDNGEYPLTPNKSGNLRGPNGTNTSKILFKALYMDGAQDPAKKIYLESLNPANNKQGWTSGPASNNTKIVDPWGNQYCYRSAVNSSGNTNRDTQNPGFDLWSMGKDGASNASRPTTEGKQGEVNRDDIRNF